MKEVPRKLVTVLAELALPKCIVPVKYVTRLTAIPSVVNLSQASTPDKKQKHIRERQKREVDRITEKRKLGPGVEQR